MNEQKIITRNWIHPEAHFYASQRGFKLSGFEDIIDYWKKMLIDHGAAQGQKIGLALPPTDIAYVALTFASFELGLKVVVLLKPIIESEFTSPKFLAHLPLDILVIDHWTVKDTKLENHFIKHSKVMIKFKTIDYIFFSPTTEYRACRPIIEAKPDGDILLCTSSGTTGEPKLINHSHKFLYDLCSTNWKQLEFEEEDRVLHLATFNHGSSLSIFFLPALKICKWHYFYTVLGFNSNSYDEENWDRFVKFCKKNKITKILFPFSFYTDSMLAAIDRDKDGLPDLTLMVLSFINPKWLSIAKSGKIKKIISIYGCSEAGGPLFLPQIGPETTSIFNPKFLGKPIEGFYDTKVVNQMLTVTLPDGKVIETDDYLDETDQGCFFIKKKKLSRINDIEINVLDIIDLFETNIEHLSRNEIVVIVDEIYNELYVVTSNSKSISEVAKMKNIVKTFYKEQVELADFIYIEFLNVSVVGMKPDKERILDYIRQKKNEQN